MKQLGTWAIQFRKHIKRPKAVGGWIIVLLVFALYTLTEVGDLKRLAPIAALGQLSLIMLGVVLSYIFLPDPERDIEAAVRRSHLWLVDPKALQSVLSPDRLKGVARELLVAAAPGRAETAWEHGCRPILELDDHPDALLRDVSYEVWMEPLDDIPMYSVKTSISNRRVLPMGEPVLWVSFARTPQRLEEEFEARGCLLRELVPAQDGYEWNQVVENHLNAVLIIDSKEHQPRIERLGSDLVRMVFDDVPRLDSPHPTKLEAWFAVPLSTRSFDVRFASYYCLGTTEIEFFIDDEGVERVDASIFLTREFENSPQGYIWQKEETRSRAPGKSEHRFKLVRIGPDRLVWPGSGVQFTWERRRHAVTE